jgi:hypothetical protein
VSDYSKYTDEKRFPRYGGDEFDPPPYVLDLRREGIKASRPSNCSRCFPLALLILIAAVAVLTALAMRAGA